MSYVNALLQYRDLADKILAGEHKPQSKEIAAETKKSLLARPERKQEQPQPQASGGGGANQNQALMDYMAAMRKRQRDEAANAAEGPSAPMINPPAAGGGGKGQELPSDTFLHGIMNTTFQSRLGLDEKASGTLTQALLMNFQDESGLIPDRVETVPNVHGTRGKGYYQLTGPRRDAFEARFGADGYTAENQINFLVDELTGSEKAAGQRILAAAQSGNVGETAAVIVDKFLRPAEKHKISRMAKYRGNA